MLNDSIIKVTSETVIRNGYAKIAGGAYQISYCLKLLLPEFLSEWDDLPEDTYSASLNCARYRRFGRFDLRETQQGFRTSALPNGPYRQALQYNPVLGDTDRWFEPLPHSTCFTSWLNCLIEVDWLMVKQIHTTIEVGWIVGVHQIRVQTLDHRMSKPTPEGMHKDGELYTFCHLIERRDISGGDWVVKQDTETSCVSIKNRVFLDTVVIQDSSVQHCVTPIQGCQPDQTGYRDVLLIDFNPIALTESERS